MLNKDLKAAEAMENSIMTSPEASQGQLKPASMIPRRSFEQIKPQSTVAGNRTSVIYSKQQGKPANTPIPPVIQDVAESETPHEATMEEAQDKTVSDKVKQQSWERLGNTQRAANTRMQSGKNATQIKKKRSSAAKVSGQENVNLKMPDQTVKSQVSAQTNTLIGNTQAGGLESVNQIPFVVIDETKHCHQNKCHLAKPAAVKKIPVTYHPVEAQWKTIDQTHRIENPPARP